MDQLRVQEPHATIVEEFVGILRSDRLPVVNDRVALILRLEGVTHPPAAGSPPPDGVLSRDEQSRVKVTCALSIFEAETGEFLVSMGRGEPEP